MEAFKLVGNFIRWSVLAGGAGALVMVLVLWIFTISKLANAKMVLAVGSLITRRYERAIMVGSVIHAFLGVFFGECYAFVLMGINHPGIGPNLIMGAGIGMFHGLIMSMVLVVSVAESHPLEEFQERGYAIALSHWVAHVFYGATVGAIIGASGLIGAGA